MKVTLNFPCVAPQTYSALKLDRLNTSPTFYKISTPRRIIPKAKSRNAKGGKSRVKKNVKSKRDTPPEKSPSRVEVFEVGEKGMLIEELALNLGISTGTICGYLFSKGIRPDGVQALDSGMVKLISAEYGVEVIDAVPEKVEDMAKKRIVIEEDDVGQLEARPPVLTIMGHVDHGKTTLLDFIRKSQVTASEAGGITQRIGAYKVMVPVDGQLKPCVFIDTPGHEAFGAMRAHGAQVTDIVVIVVAADDGVRPQTNEAVAHAKAAEVPIIVAINKIDKQGSDPERTMQELSSIGLMPEIWGGDTPMVKISALKGDNVDELLDTIMLIAELQELKANPNRKARGTVIEAGLDKAKGPVLTLIVQTGTLKKGDIAVCADSLGKVRAIFDDHGKMIDIAGPSMPVQVIGLDKVPASGDVLEVVRSFDIARKKAESHAILLRENRHKEEAEKLSLSSMASVVAAEKLSGLKLHHLNIVLKADLQGSLEAIKKALQMLPQNIVTLRFVLHSTGNINRSDVDLAFSSKGIVLGFNVKTIGSLKSYAEHKGVEIRIYNVIYDLIDDVKNAMEGLLEPFEEEQRMGLAEVKAVFSSSSIGRKGRAAGCMVLEGCVTRGCRIKVVRDGNIVHASTLHSLKKFKDDVKEVTAGNECGIGVNGFNDWKKGDIIEAFNVIKRKHTLEGASALMASAVKDFGI